MSRIRLSCLMAVVCHTLVICGATEFFTVTIYDSPQRVVRLQTISVDAVAAGYSHPSLVSKEQMTSVLEGLYVEVDDTSFSRPGMPRRAFSDGEIQFFAPLLVQGLQQATPEEIVTFFETAEISDSRAMTTSGGVFVKDNAVHVLLSNYNVKTQIWQDNDAYEAPYRLSPLEPIDPEPGRLLYQPAEYMVVLEEHGWFDSLKGKPWHAAVSYTELPLSSTQRSLP